MATLEDSLAVSHETRYTFTTWSRNFAPWYLLKTVENMSIQKTYTQCLWQLIHHCQNLEATKVSFSRWIDKCTVAHLDNGILFSSKKKWTSPLWKDMKATLIILLCERCQAEKATYCMISTMWHSGKGRSVETINTSLVVMG